MRRLRGDKNIPTVPDLGNANVGTEWFFNPLPAYGVLLYKK